MSDYFRDWKAAHTAAVHRARETGRDVGIEKWSSGMTPGMRFRIFPLPSVAASFGFEARCERVRPTDPL